MIMGGRVLPGKTNMSPENQWLEDVFPIEIVPFGGHSLVFGGVDPIAHIFGANDATTDSTFPPDLGDANG